MPRNQRSSRRLNLGGGPGPLPSNWTHLDGSWNARLSKCRRIRRLVAALGIVSPENAALEWSPDIVCSDLRRPLPFPSDTFEAIYASHVLEHLHADEGGRLLRECHSALQPGGAVRIVVRDLRSMVGYLHAAASPTRNGGDLPADRLNDELHLRPRSHGVGHIIFRAYSGLTGFQWHKWMYDAESLIQRVSAAGFVAVEQRPYLESRIGGIDAVERPGRVLDGAGVCVEALRPA